MLTFPSKHKKQERRKRCIFHERHVLRIFQRTRSGDILRQARGVPVDKAAVADKPHDEVGKTELCTYGATADDGRADTLNDRSLAEEGEIVLDILGFASTDEFYADIGL